MQSLKLVSYSEANWQPVQLNEAQRYMFVSTEVDKQLSCRRETARALKSVEILSAAAQLYEKSPLTRRIAFLCGIKISPVGSLDQSESTRVTDGETDRRPDGQNYDSQDRASIQLRRAGKSHFFCSAQLLNTDLDGGCDQHCRRPSEVYDPHRRTKLTALATISRSRILVENRRFNLPHLYLAPPLGITALEFRRDLWYQKSRKIALS